MERDDAAMAKPRGEPSDALHRAAQAAVLGALAAGQDDAFELLLTVRPYEVRGRFTPDVALLELAAAALARACPPDTGRLRYEGLTDRYLPELALDGRTLRHRTQYAIQAAACLRAGLEPDLLADAGGWEPGLWTYAVTAVVLYVRAAADRCESAVADIAVQVADELGVPLPTTGGTSG
jgi:hypothetical protein